MLDKRGQLTIFVIFTVLIVAIIGLIFFIEVLKEERKLEGDDNNFENDKISRSYEDVRQCLYLLVEGMNVKGRMNERVVEEYLAVNSYICFEEKGSVNVKVNPPFKVEVSEDGENYYFEIKLDSEFESQGVVSIVEDFSVEISKGGDEDEIDKKIENISFVDSEDRISYVDREFGIVDTKSYEFIVEYDYYPEDILGYELVLESFNISSRDFLFTNDELIELMNDTNLFEIILNHSYDEIFSVNNSNISFEEIKDRLEGFDFISNISRNHEYQLMDYREIYSFRERDTRVSDEFFRQQWYLENKGQFFGKRGADINIFPAWEVTKGKSETLIAVIDQGVFMNEDYREKISKKSFNFVDNSRDVNSKSEYEYHGSHVVGVISSEVDNEYGISGICPNCSILIAKVANSQGKINSNDLSKAVVYAVNNGADVISLSLGGESYSAYEEGLFNRLTKRGVIIVAAAGNDGTRDKTYPAAYKDVISVGASDNLDKRAYFSNYGTWVDVYAPGRMILSVCGKDKYCFDSGTSMATPIVSGIIGLMLSINEDLTKNDIVKGLKGNGKEIEFGSYRVDAGEVLSSMISGTQEIITEELNESYVNLKIEEIIQKRKEIIENRELLIKSLEVHESFVRFELDELIKYCNINVDICKEYCDYFKRDDTACNFVRLLK